MFQIRPFQNTDVAGIVSVWNSLLQIPNVACPLSASEFEILVLSKPYFEAEDLLVGVDQDSGAILGFAHCGFGPENPEKFCQKLDRSMGTIAMLCCQPDTELENALIQSAVLHLRQKGSKVIYAGGRYPLNPFYWGIYGGSEYSGFLADHPGIHQALTRNHFQESARNVLFEYNLAKNEPRHVKNAILKRESRLRILEEENPQCLWTTLAVELFHPLVVELFDRHEKERLGSATLWPMSIYGREQDKSLIGMIDVWIDQTQRRRGFGRLLITETVKCAMELSYDKLCVQTDASNLPAINLYQALGFTATDSTVFYRLSGD